MATIQQTAIVEQVDYRTALAQVVQRGVKTYCEVSQIPFSAFNRERLCKRCLRSISVLVAAPKIVVPGFIDQRAHKVCQPCYADYQAISKITAEWRLDFGVDSAVSDQWLTSFGANRGETQLIQEYAAARVRVTELLAHRQQAYLLFREQFDQKEQAIARYTHEGNYSKLLLSVRDNYSLLDLIARLRRASQAVTTVGYTQTQILQQGLNSVRQVLEAFIVLHGHTVGYSNDVYNLAVFLLAFNSEHRALALLTALYQRVIPQSVWPLYTQQMGPRLKREEYESLLGILAAQFSFDQTQLVALGEFIDVHGSSYLASGLVGKLNVSSSLVVFEHLARADINEKQQAFLKAFAALIASNASLIQRLTPRNLELPRQILAATTSSKLQALIPKITWTGHLYNAATHKHVHRHEAAHLKALHHDNERLKQQFQETLQFKNELEGKLILNCVHLALVSADNIRLRGQAPESFSQPLVTLK